MPRWVWVVIIIGSILICGSIVLYFLLRKREESSDCDPACRSDQTCVKGKCSDIDCTTGLICPLESPFCSAEKRCVVCLRDENCPYNNRCDPQTQQCVLKTCQIDQDCLEGEICQGSICLSRHCLSSSDCVSGQACVESPSGSSNNFCRIVGDTCSSDICQNGDLICSKETCVQCRNNNDCLSTQFCSNGICKSDCQKGDCGDGRTCITKSGICCVDDGNTGKVCSSSTDCGNNFCIDGVCTCQIGKDGDVCSKNLDCASTKCDQMFIPTKTDDGKLAPYCSFSAQCRALDPKSGCFHQTCGIFKSTCTNKNIECKYSAPGNLGILDREFICHSDIPYCVDNKCKSSKEGMMCNANDDCQGKEPLFCVNDHCQTTRGLYGDRCGTGDSCSEKLECLVNDTGRGIENCLRPVSLTPRSNIDV